MKSKLKRKKKFDLIVIDGLNLAYRYFWILKNFRDSKGNKTGLCYGVLNHIYQMKNRHNKAEIIMAWDTNSTFKKSIYPEYKANRKHKGEDGFKDQIREVKLLLSLYNIKQYYAKGYEADDVAAKIVRKNKDKNILLVSGDNDWTQMLVNKNVRIQIKKEIYAREQIEEERDVDVSKHRLYKAITGEKKENIKGIKFFPKDMAWELAKSCDSPSNMVKLCREKIGCGLKRNDWYRKIVHNRKLIAMNFKLKKLLDRGYNFNIIKRKNNKKQLIRRLKKMEMKKLIERIRNE